MWYDIYIYIYIYVCVCVCVCVCVIRRLKVKDEGSSNAGPTRRNVFSHCHIVREESSAAKAPCDIPHKT